MFYIVVEEKEGRGYMELLQCSEEIHAKQMVEELYRESKARNENRKFKYIEMTGNLVLPAEKPRQSKEERIQEKVSKLFNL